MKFDYPSRGETIQPFTAAEISTFLSHLDLDATASRKEYRDKIFTIIRALHTDKKALSFYTGQFKTYSCKEILSIHTFIQSKFNEEGTLKNFLSTTTFNIDEFIKAAYEMVLGDHPTTKVSPTTIKLPLTKEADSPNITDQPLLPICDIEQSTETIDQTSTEEQPDSIVYNCDYDFQSAVLVLDVPPETPSSQPSEEPSPTTITTTISSSISDKPELSETFIDDDIMRTYKGYVYTVHSKETNEKITRLVQYSTLRPYVGKDDNLIEPYFCKIHTLKVCNFRSKLKQKIIDHMFTAKFYVKCPLCGKKISTRENMMAHLNNTHKIK